MERYQQDTASLLTKSNVQMMTWIKFMRKDSKSLFTISQRKSKTHARILHKKLAYRCTWSKFSNIFADHLNNVLRSLRHNTLNNKHEQEFDIIKTIDTMLGDLHWASLPQTLTSKIFFIAKSILIHSGPPWSYKKFNTCPFWWLSNFDCSLCD
jgi:hypothetical protein